MASVYYPSLVVNLKLSFDDTLTVAIPGFSAEKPASVESVFGGVAAVTRPAVQPLVFSSGTPSYVLNRVPSSASIELPGHRPAGRFNLTFPFKDMPIDPRTISGAAVDIYLGTVAADAFADGMRGKSQFGVKPSVLDTSGFFGTTVSQNLLMSGIVDEWQAEHTEDDSTVSISGRDMRGILIDTPIGTNPKNSKQTILETLNLLQPVHLVIRDLLKSHPMAAMVKVRISLTEWLPGLPPAPGGDILARPRRGAKGGTQLGGRPAVQGTQNKLSFWDAIVQLCFVCGAIPHFVGTELRIRPVRSLYDQQRAGFDPLVPTPFDGGLPRAIDAESGSPMSPLSVRKMVYGRDVGGLSFSRKFGGYRRPRQVRVTSVDAGAFKRGDDRTIEGVYPSNEIANRVYASGQKSMADIVFVPVAGIRDEDRLTQIAQSIYEEAGRGEITGKCSTPKLSSFGGDNADPDLTRLRPGDAVEFNTDVRALRRNSPLVSEYTNHMRAPFEEQVTKLSERIGDENLARVILSTARGLIREVQGFFRVSAVRYNWSAEGLKVDFDFQNFIEARNDASKTPSKSGGPLDELLVPSQEKGGL